MARVALLSNPRSTGNRALLPRVRSFCAGRSDIFHYEVGDVAEIGEALRTIALVRPKVLVINGGDGTVQSALTELYQGGHFGDEPPPVAVLPNGKTNLIALDLGAQGDPIAALERVLEIAANETIDANVVARELIALSDGEGSKAVLGMFLGGGGLADSMLYCRNKIYPLGLPNGFSHVLTVLAVIFSMLFQLRAAFLPPLPRPLTVSLMRQGILQGAFSIMIVTTLERMLVGTRAQASVSGAGALKLMTVDHRPGSLVRAIVAGLQGKLQPGGRFGGGVHIAHGDEIRIEGHRSSVILDGELFEAAEGRSIVLRQTRPVPFLRLAA